MAQQPLLNRIHTPADLQEMSVQQLQQLCAEIREKLIQTVSKNGGHLASNLGVVELTVALHKVFQSSGDTIIWDVGHQCYTHKILTGRLQQMDSIRQEGGISGFPKRKESLYDPLDSGHSSTSISSAFGIANAKSLLNLPGSVVAVIGDGALTGGLAYEGLNNAGRYKKNFIVVLNDNHMSISTNVGSMARYLAVIRTKPFYLRMKVHLEKFLTHVPIIGKALRRFLIKSKSLLKTILYNDTLFDDMGFLYYGPIDGHDIEKLIDVLRLAQKLNQPVLVHVITKKGKGYPFAEKDPKAFHGVSSFDVETGEALTSSESFSEAFGVLMCCLAEADERVCAITAAMKPGTGLSEFARIYKERFFDVGIAEEHAVTFAGGLAAGGMLPVFAVYSTFLQRSYDQIIHDAALQNVKVTLAIDRAGIVGEDGETHQGIFDVAFLNSIPNVTVYSPCYFDELGPSFRNALYGCSGVAAVRYPRGGELYRPAGFQSGASTYTLWGDPSPNLLITYGRLFSFACMAQEELAHKGIHIRVVKLNQIKPLDPDVVELAAGSRQVFFYEEGMRSGGVGERLGALLAQREDFSGAYHLSAIEDCFVAQANMLRTLQLLRLDNEAMVEDITRELVKDDG